MKKKKLHTKNFLILLLWIAVFAIVSLSYQKNSTTTSSENFNVILIDVDTLRSDHLGAYGYEKDTSPNIDKFAKESLVFTNAVSQSVWTLTSVVSVFTSKYPSTHGVLSKNDRIIDKDITLAEILKDNGYKTQAFVGAQTTRGDMLSVFGFAKGFDEYNDWIGLYYNTSIPLATEWLKKNSDQKFFLFIHSYDVHDPYHKPEPYENFFDPTYSGFVDKLTLTTDKGGDITKVKKFGDNYVYLNDTQNVILSQKDVDHIIAHYDGNIRYADSWLGKFLSLLENLHLMNKTIVIIFGDHGETLFDHVLEESRSIGHSGLYDEVIRVPLIIKHPFFNGTIEKQAQLIDITPTLLDFLKIEIPEYLQGKSLVPLIKNNTDINPEAFSEGFQGTKSVRTLKWKLISKFHEFELYDLVNDKKEQNNVAFNFTEIGKDLENKLLLRFLR